MAAVQGVNKGTKRKHKSVLQGGLKRYTGRLLYCMAEHIVNTGYRSQKYSACQLIAAINARIFLGLGDVSDKIFEELVDRTFGRYGACIGVHNSYEDLGLNYINGDPVDPSLEWVKDNLPVEIAIHSKKYGLHSILVIGVNEEELHIINGDSERIIWKDLVAKIPVWQYNRRFRSFKKK